MPKLTSVGSVLWLWVLILVAAACGDNVRSNAMVALEISPTDPTIAVGTDFQLEATAIYADSSTKNVTSEVTWSSASMAIATVSAQGLGAGLAPGTTTVAATLTDRGGATMSASTKLMVTTAKLVSIGITPADPTIAKGSTQQFTATGTFSDNTTQNITNQVTWSSSMTSVASLSTGGLATGLSPGQTTVTAAMAGASGSTRLTVTDAMLSSIQVTPPSPSVARGLDVQFTATGVYTDNTTQDLTTQVTWSSGTIAVATISNITGSRGLANTLSAGTSTITATLGTVSGATVLTVTAATLASIQVTPADQSIAKGQSLQYTATGILTDSSTVDLTTQVIWLSSATSVATISNGISRGLASTSINTVTGQTTISATLGSLSGTTTLTVTDKILVSIQVTPPNPTIAKGTSLQFTATGIYSDNSTQNLTTQVTWSSGTTTVATISNASGSQGLASTSSSTVAGTTTISAMLGALAGSTTLTVTAAALVSIQVTPPNPTISKGTSRQFTATGIYSDNTTQDLTTQVTWGSSLASVASISNAAGSQGLASTGVNTVAGQTTITATLGAISGSTVLTVTAATLVSIQVTPANPTIGKGTSVPFTATGTYSDTTTQDLTTQVAWTSSATTVATISNAAGSQGLASTSINTVTGMTTITATLGMVAGSTTLTVTTAVLVSIQVSPSASSIPKGLARQFTATGFYSDGTSQNLTNQVTWSSSSPSVATISNSSPTQGLASTSSLTVTGTTTITATLGAISGSATLTVTDAVLITIQVTPPNPVIAKGTSQQFVATGIFSDNSTQDVTSQVTWTSSNQNVATISPNGGLASTSMSTVAGMTTITATLNANSGSTTLTVTDTFLVSIQVTPTDPTIAKGSSQQFVATGTYSDMSTQILTAQVTWSSSNQSVATITTNSGLASTSAMTIAGSTTITATLGAISGSTLLTVSPATLVSISVSPIDPFMPDGTSDPFTASGTFSDGSVQDLTTTVVWTSSAPLVASVGSGTGVVTAEAIGTADITATMPGTGISGVSTVTVTSAVLTSIVVTPTPISIPKGTSQQFIAEGIYTDGTTTDLTASVTWSSSDATSLFVTATGGLATANVDVGTYTITATDSTTGLFGVATVTLTGAVLVTIQVDPANTTLPRATQEDYTATGIYSDFTTVDLTDLVTWSTTNTVVATISNGALDKGTLTTIAAGTTLVRAVHAGITGETLLTVRNTVLVSIEVLPSTATLADGARLQYTAIGHYADGSTRNITQFVSWSSTSNNVAGVSNGRKKKGVATGKSPGMTTVTATQGSISGTAALTVTNATLMSIAIVPGSTSIPLKGKTYFSAIGTYSDGSTSDLTTVVSWTSSNTAAATISNQPFSEGTATAVGAGTTTITATDPGTLTVATATLTVTNATLVSIAVTPASPNIILTTSLQMTATGTYSDMSTRNITREVTWISGNTGIATVLNVGTTKGTVSSVATGTTSITANYPQTGIAGATNVTIIP